MKSAVRFQAEGKVDDVGARNQTPLSEAELLDSKVALIQALIPLGLQAVAEALEGEVTGLTGHRNGPKFLDSRISEISAVH